MERDDVELIHSVLSGDEIAFSELVQKYQKSVHALVWRKIGDFHIAEEITQDTFLQAHKKLGSLKNPSQLAGWLYVIADRLCKAWFRKKKLYTQSLETTSAETLEKAAYADYACEQREDAAVENRRKIVQKLMEKLPESERTVMVLHYLGEMSCEAISKFLGVSPNTVKSRLKRARERLQNEERIIRETLGSVPLRPDLTESIMRRIDTIKQTSPSGGKPLLPFAALGASAILVIFLMGANKQFTANFQRPYSVDAKSEPTIEIIDTSVVLNIQSKPELQNRVSGTNQSKNRNNDLSKGTETVENNLTQDAMQWNLPEDAKARIGKGRINEIQYSPDGTILAVASGIGIWLYDTTKRQEVSLLTEHTSAVDCLAFSPDGRILASGGSDYGTIILWDRSTGSRKTLTGHTFLISNLVFSPDGRMIASDSRDGTIRLWDVINGEAKYTFTKESERTNPERTNTNMLSFTPDERTIVYVSWDNKISLWDSITGEHKNTFDMLPECSTTGAAFSPDGKTVAIGSANETIYLYDLETGELKMTLTGHGKHVDHLAFSPDGKTFTTASYDGEIICLWDANTGEHRLTLTAPNMQYIQGLAFSPDGKTLASGSGDGTIRFWDVDSGNEKHIFTGHSESVMSVAFNRNGNIIASGSTNGIVRLWNADTEQYIKTLKALNGFKDTAHSMLFGLDGKTLTCGTDDGIRLWNIHTGDHKKMFHINDPFNPILRAFSPDGNTVASMVDDEKTISLWDVHTGKRKKTLKGHTNHLSCLVFCPDGKTLASASYTGTIRLWDVDSGKNKTLKGHNDWVSSLAFSPDGNTLTSGSDDTTIRFWDVDTGENKMTLTGSNWHHSYALAFSPDGKTLVSGDRSKNICFFDVHTGEQKNTFSGHTDLVRSIAFSSDGKTLVSGSLDGTVLLWEIDP